MSDEVDLTKASSGENGAVPVRRAEPWKGSILADGTPEQRAVIALSRVDDRLPDDLYRDIFSARLDWPWIVMQAMNHRTLGMAWHTLTSRSLFDLAVKAGLARNWIVYLEQLSRASAQKNHLWLAELERVFEAYARRGIASVAIKGTALIGDIYTPAQRMLGDTDTLIERDAVEDVVALLKEMGFEHGTIDPATSTLKPISKERLRFWNFNAHLMPKFSKPTGVPECPFFRLAVGFDFFDPHDEYSVPSEAVIARRIARPGSALATPCLADGLINLCIHVYREAISATFAFIAENWHLWIFCDLLTLVQKHDGAELREQVQRRVAALGIDRPCYFAFHYAYAVYGDPLLMDWRDLFDAGADDAFLYQLVDGRRRVEYRRPFPERLFDTRQVVIPGLEPVWSKAISDGEWWG